MTAEDNLRTELEALTYYQFLKACAAFISASSSAPEAAMRHVLGSLARR